MRILNLDTLKSDMELHFGGTKANPAFVTFFEWMEKAWVKHLIKSSEKDNYFLPVQVLSMPSFFKSDNGPIPDELLIETPNGDVKLEPQSEWDISDAKKEVLWYYYPTTHSISKFRDEIINVRDYVLSQEQTVLANLQRRNWPDTVKAADKWHGEQRRILEERMRAQAAELANRLTAEAKERQASLESVEGPDWFRALDEPFIIGGKQYTLVRLISQRALNHESYIMDHCVHTYGHRLFDSETVILSVRALEDINLPLVTVEFWCERNSRQPPYLVQIKGIHNHDANQTIYGIGAAIKLLQFPERTIKPLSRNPDDLSFRVDRNPQ
jgi:hypothetical protein